jgi:putative addiction module component (TIGR02574 family)
MIAETIPAIGKLTEDEKWLLIEELTEELSSKPGAYPVRADHVALLEQRFAEYRKDPSTASTWEEVKRRFERARANAR